MGHGQGGRGKLGGHFLLTAAVAAGLTAGCGGGGGPKLPPAEEAQKQITALSVPRRSIGVESFTDNEGLGVLAPAVFPEVAALLALGPEGAAPLLATFGDPARDGTEDGDRVRALAAHVLEQWKHTAALPDLRAYLARAVVARPVPFFSLQATAHAVAVLGGPPARVRGLYGMTELMALAAATPPSALALTAGALTVNTRAGNPIEHEHLIGSMVPPATWTGDFSASERQQRDDVFLTKDDGIALFEDPISLLEPATRSYDCHSFTFRRDDTKLVDLNARYHILGEAVPGILADEGWTDVTTSPATWRVGDVVVFYKNAGGVPTHTGRLSAVGSGVDDPRLRFTSKWSVFHPVVDVSVRDCSKLYGKVVKIYTQLRQCVTEVRAAGSSTCARRADGTVWCWGNNQFGQLGNGTTAESATPVQVTGLVGATALAVGSGFACAAKTDGTVWCWGQNQISGALGDGTMIDRSTPVQVMGLTGAVQLAASIGGACARKEDRSVWCWGASLGVAPVRIVAAGPPPNDPAAFLAADDIDGGHGGFGAQSPDFFLWGWDGARGSFPGQSGSSWRAGSEALPANGAFPVTTAATMLNQPPMRLAGGLRAPVVGRRHACTLVGTAVSCWGTNDHGQLGRIPMASAHQYPATVADLPAAIDLAAGNNHTCARAQDGAVWCWGGGVGPLRADSPTPTAVAGLPTLTSGGKHSLAAGDGHTCAVTSSALYCWGSNLFGEVGSGSATPTQVDRPTAVALPCPP